MKAAYSASDKHRQKRAPSSHDVEGWAKSTPTQETPGDAISFILLEDLEDLIRKEAYCIAERRGFAPGRELEDWLDAEEAVLARRGLKTDSNSSFHWRQCRIGTEIWTT